MCNTSLARERSSDLLYGSIPPSRMNFVALECVQMKSQSRNGRLNGEMSFISRRDDGARRKKSFFTMVLLYGWAHNLRHLSDSGSG